MDVELTKDNIHEYLLKGVEDVKKLELVFTPEQYLEICVSRVRKDTI